MPETTLILLAEDDHFLSFLLRGKLEKEGFTVRQATDGEDALKLMRSEKPGLMVLDLIMPKISGFEVLETMSIDPELNKIPVIILSNLAQEEDIARAKQLGALEYFVKARTSIDEIVTTIKNTQLKVA